MNRRGFLGMAVGLFAGAVAALRPTWYRPRYRLLAIRREGGPSPLDTVIKEALEEMGRKRFFEIAEDFRLEIGIQEQLRANREALS